MSPDIFEYHRSITKEFEILEDRIGHLVSHNQTRGEWKEAILRTILRRHLPEAIRIGQGFIVTREHSSTQIDVLVLKPGKPTLFQDGGLFIVTPDVPSAIIEVKSKIQGSQQWQEVSKKLARHGEICGYGDRNRPWLGIFSFQGDEGQISYALDAASQIYKETGVVINCITVGSNYFIRYWEEGEQEMGDSEERSSKPRFRAYELIDLSYSYFVGNLVDALCNVDRRETGYTWFAYEEGKQGGERLINEMVLEYS